MGERSATAIMYLYGEEMARHKLSSYALASALIAFWQEADETLGLTQRAYAIEVDYGDAVLESNEAAQIQAIRTGKAKAIA